MGRGVRPEGGWLSWLRALLPAELHSVTASQAGISSLPGWGQPQVDEGDLAHRQEHLLRTAWLLRRVIARCMRAPL